jgi:hypothetical protein
MQVYFMKKSSFLLGLGCTKRAPRGPSGGARPKQNFLQHGSFAWIFQINFNPFCSTNPEIIGIKFEDRLTAKILTPYTCAGGFFLV